MSNFFKSIILSSLLIIPVTANAMQFDNINFPVRKSKSFVMSSNYQLDFTLGSFFDYFKPNLSEEDKSSSSYTEVSGYVQLLSESYSSDSGFNLSESTESSSK